MCGIRTFIAHGLKLCNIDSGHKSSYSREVSADTGRHNRALRGQAVLNSRIIIIPLPEKRLILGDILGENGNNPTFIIDKRQAPAASTRRAGHVYVRLQFVQHVHRILHFASTKLCVPTARTLPPRFLAAWLGCKLSKVQQFHMSTIQMLIDLPSMTTLVPLLPCSPKLSPL